MKKLSMLLISLCLAFGLTAQNIDDLIFQDKDKEETKESIKNDVIQVNFKPKSARRAMLYSALFPGAGQFYADKSALTTYLFPVLEAAMIGGIVYFSSQGSKKEKVFEKYANGETITQTFTYVVHDTTYSFTYTGPRYNRDFQSYVEDNLMGLNYRGKPVLQQSFNDIYDGTLFRLDSKNSQHFYEDIGKYNRYIFGWVDWFANFAIDPRANNASIQDSTLSVLNLPEFRGAWVTSGDNFETFRWNSNYRIEDFLNPGVDNPVPPSLPSASPMRQKYIALRNDSKDQYSYASYFTMGLAFNHIASAIDAVVLTNKTNRSALTQNPLQLHYYTALRESRITPSLGLSYNF